MRRFLLVGCGGSGGATLQFLMDQLRADLAERHIERLPQGWQFLHVDVPLSGDGVGPGMPPLVVDQGGRYVGLASAAANYPGVTAAVERQLRYAEQLAELAAWRPYPPDTNIPVTHGAGKMRGVGRIITLSAVGRIRDALTAAWSALASPQAQNELTRVAAAFSPQTAGQVTDNPVVLVVSSMAGGAGASMVLDVCRLLTELPAYEPASTGVFLYTPEVFTETLKTQIEGVHVQGNGLGMMGELVATQLGAGTASDARLYRALGLTVPAGDGAPFRRVFPVGARSGAHGAVFGDGSLEGIYRGVGRGLAALLLSGQGMSTFLKSDIENNNPRPGSLESLGWASDPDRLQWGSFGFASLGLGRDRYAEYAAQRLARVAVDRLVSGHLQPGDRRPAGQQIQDRLSDLQPVFVEQLGLPSGAATRTWFESLVGGYPTAQASAIVGELVQPRLRITQRVDTRQWVQASQWAVSQEGKELSEAVERAAHRWAGDWYRALLGSVESAVEAVTVDNGLAVARDLLDRVSDAVDAWVADLRAAAEATPQDATALPAQVSSQLSGVKGLVDPGHGLVGVLAEGYAHSTAVAITGRIATLVADVLASLRTDLLAPLRETCDASLRLLTAVTAERATDTGLARLRTEEYAAWPDQGEEVPGRFLEAHNEVLLTGAEAFPTLFEYHAAESEQSLPPADAVARIATRVLVNRWETTGVAPAGGLLRRLATWRPGALRDDPSSPASVRLPMRRARYELAVRPAEILDRARAWIGRPKEAFNAFVNQTLQDYVLGDDVDEPERRERGRALVESFRSALEMARPLVAVNREMVRELHGSDDLQLSYKFSQVALPDRGLAGELARVAENLGATPDTLTGLQRALASGQDATRLDVFGSFAPLNPVAVTSLTAPLARGWAAATSPEARRDYWSRRRARRLPGGVPMGDRQRRAVVGGWYVARLTGRLRLPGEWDGGRDVQVWDAGWTAFPSPLLVAAEDMHSRHDVLPSVLMSSVLAMAQCGAVGNLTPLRPYTVLRRLWDSTTAGAGGHVRPRDLAAAGHLAAWFRGGAAPDGAPEQYRRPRQETPEQNRTAMLEQLAELRQIVARDFLPAGAVDGAGGGAFAAVEAVDDVSLVPLYHELAPDIHAVLGVLVEMLETMSLVESRAGYERDVAL